MSNRKALVIGVDPGATGAWSVVYVNEDEDASQRIYHMTGGLIPYKGAVARVPDSVYAPSKYNTKRIDREALDFTLPNAIRNTSKVTIIIEEPPPWMGKAANKSNGATQVILGRYMEAIVYMLRELLPLASMYTVPPGEWQGCILSTYIPKVITTDMYADCGILADRALDTKRRAYLACAVEFGPDWQTSPAGVLRSQAYRWAVSDATCIALYGCMKLGIGTTNLSTHPDALKALYTRKRIQPLSGDTGAAFGTE